MIWNLDILWMTIAGATVAGISYMLCLLMESSIGRQGYGPFLNATFITAGFFGAIYYANTTGMRLGELKMAIIVGGAGAFGLLLVMILLRAIVLRFG